MSEGVDFFGRLCLEGAYGFRKGFPKTTLCRELLKYKDLKTASLRRTISIVRNLFHSEIHTSSH
jgi:hypothetical protein